MMQMHDGNCLFFWQRNGYFFFFQSERERVLLQKLMMGTSHYPGQREREKQFACLPEVPENESVTTGLQFTAAAPEIMALFGF